MKAMTITLRLYPYKPDDPVLMVELVHPREDGFWLLAGLAVNEPEEWLLDLLTRLAMTKLTALSQEDLYSMYYYCVSFRIPRMVEITHEYQPSYAFRPSYTNLEKIIAAILEFRNNHIEKYLELTLTDEEGPYLILNQESNS